MRVGSTLAVSLVLVGCRERPRETPQAASAVTQPPTASATATPSAALPPIPSGPTHFAVTSPPGASKTCKPLPKGGRPAMTALANALRRLSCEPALFLTSSAALRADLALPADHTVELSGPSTVSVRFPKGRAADLALTMGLGSAVAARSKTGAWGWRIWNLASDPASGKLEHWGPGVAVIGVEVDGGKVDDKISQVVLGDALLEGYASVTMPESVLPLQDDAIAVGMLLGGLEKLASDTKQLASDPADAARFAKLDDERFRVSTRSLHSGPSVVKGLDVWTARTRVAAGPVIERLGLSGKIEHSRARDSDEYLLFDGARTEHTWRGMKLTLRFDARSGTAAAGPHGGYVLSGVTLGQ
ncbi:MAG: hypothetical protein HYZ29_21745 [Myxococcales bacterium]|nr:hypothetical protein [Myxococcales bacterium]